MPKPIPQPTPPGPLDLIYDVDEAAAYLGLKLESFKYHLYVSKKITGTLKGNSLIFTRAQLDIFKARRVIEYTGELMDKHMAAARMREDGYTLTEIATALGYKGQSGASRAVSYGREKLSHRPKPTKSPKRPKPQKSA